jgi:hypothetical protein
LRRALSAVALLAAVAAVTVAVPGAGRAQGTIPSDVDRYFTLIWEGAERRGRPIVRGYIVNNYGLTAADVRLRVESLDAGGKVVATTTGYVSREITPGSRAYFEVPMPARAPSYRVSVVSCDWRFGASG